MTDFRALCAELITALHDAADDVEGWGNYASSYFQEKHDLAGNIAKIHAQADHARSALSQPEPQGPTDEELLETAAQAVGYEHVPTDETCLALARAVLTRWGRPTVEPVAPTDEEIMELMPRQMRDDLANAARAMAGFDRTTVQAAGVMRIILNRHAVDHARAVLTRWGNHQVSLTSSTQPLPEQEVEG